MSHKFPKEKKSKLAKKFQKFADKTNQIVGSPYWFIFSVLLVVIWVPSGYILGWGEIWHLVINTTTTILTFLMMALLHASQSRWEEKMERLQQRESTEIKAIEKTAKKLAYEKGERPVKFSDVEAEEKAKESIGSLH